MDLAIKPAKVIPIPEGRTYSFDPTEMRELLKAHPDADVAIVDDKGKVMRSFNTKDYLTAIDFFSAAVQ